MAHSEYRITRKIEEYGKETRRRDGKFLSMESTCPNARTPNARTKNRSEENRLNLYYAIRVSSDEIARTKFHRVNRNLMKDAYSDIHTEGRYKSCL